MSHLDETPNDDADAAAQTAAPGPAADKTQEQQWRESDEAADKAIADSFNDDPSLDYKGRTYALAIADLSARVADLYLSEQRLPALRRRAVSKAGARAVANGLLGRINDRIAYQNARIKKNGSDPDKLTGTPSKPLARLGFAEVARLMGALYSVVSIMPSSRNSDPDLNILAAYDDDKASPHWGTYRSEVGHLRSVARRYRPDLTVKEFADVMAALGDQAPRVTRGDDPDLVPCRNGIVDYNGGDPKFIEFSPEYVFLAKLDVDWNPDAQNAVIHNDADGTDWDVESWMRDFYTSIDPLTEEEVVDEAMSELLWEVIGAVARPYNSWHKCAFLFSAQGNNGKGTLLSLMRNMLGVGNYASIPLADFGKDFLLEPLTRANAVLVDENDVGTFVEKAANFKAVVTNDVITINRKYKAPIAHQHFGFMVQCLNDPPVFKDKSESVYRRQLFIPFIKSFTGAERKYIKDDYLKRPEVLEYVLKRVLTMNYYELSEPLLVKAALSEFKNTNDPVRAFWTEVERELRWDLVPFTFAYDLYKAWMARYMPNSKPVGKNKFVTELLSLIRADQNSPWECPDQTAPHRPSSLMSAPEHLIAEYNLPEWGNPAVPTSDQNYRDRRSTIPGDRFKQVYRGITRKEHPTAPAPASASHAATEGSLTVNVNVGAPASDDPSSEAAAPQAPKNKRPSGTKKSPVTGSAAADPGHRAATGPVPAEDDQLLNSPYDLEPSTDAGQRPPEKDDPSPRTGPEPDEADN